MFFLCKDYSDVQHTGFAEAVLDLFKEMIKNKEKEKTGISNC
jgi:hypothetical protein